MLKRKLSSSISITLPVSHLFYENYRFASFIYLHCCINPRKLLFDANFIVQFGEERPQSTKTELGEAVHHM